MFSKSSEVDFSEFSKLIFLIFSTGMHADEKYTPEVEWTLMFRFASARWRNVKMRKDQILSAPDVG